MSLKCNTKAGDDSVKSELQFYIANFLELSTVVDIMHEADDACSETYGDHINIIHILCYQLCQCFCSSLGFAIFTFQNLNCLILEFANSYSLRQYFHQYSFCLQ